MNASCNWVDLFSLTIRWFFYTRSREAEYCDERVCLFVRLFVCLSAIQYNYLRDYVSNFHQIRARVTYGRGSVALWRRCNTFCTLRPNWSDDKIKFLGPPLRVSCMTLCFYLMIRNRHRKAYTYGNSDVISFHIYASWFLPPSCG